LKYPRTGRFRIWGFDLWETGHAIILGNVWGYFLFDLYSADIYWSLEKDLLPLNFIDALVFQLLPPLSSVFSVFLLDLVG